MSGVDQLGDKRFLEQRGGRLDQLGDKRPLEQRGGRLGARALVKPRQLG